MAKKQFDPEIHLRSCEIRLSTLQRLVRQQQDLGVPYPFAYLELVDRVEKLERKILRLQEQVAAAKAAAPSEEMVITIVERRTYRIAKQQHLQGSQQLVQELRRALDREQAEKVVEILELFSLGPDTSKVISMEEE